jgi:hypothetical protein
VIKPVATARRHGHELAALACVVLAALLSAFAPPNGTPVAGAHLGGAERAARLACDQRHVRACIRRAAIHRGQSYDYLVSVAWCESRFNPRAYNTASGAGGLFQFLASTWATTPQRRRSRFSAKWAALAAAWMFEHGRAREWVCA